MSGIAGIIHFDGRPAERAVIEAMTSAMAYRGPDGISHYVCGNVALGHCMFCTTPESLEETQPLTNEDESVVLVMDGRVDNWEELRMALLSEGARLRTRSDAELVLRAYERWGEGSVSRIDGDFALVIWDERLRRAFCARDRLGNKPFNYHWDGRTLIFASDVNAIVSMPGIDADLNEGMLAEYLGFEFLSRDETFWKGIHRLVASHHMAVTRTALRIERYWAPDQHTDLLYKNEREYVDHYRNLLEDVVRRLARSQATVACEVSGGLDSSAIFAVAENLRQKQRLPAPGLEGYTLDFSFDADANELEYSRAVGIHLSKPIHEVAPTQMPLSWYRDCARRSGEVPSTPTNANSLGLQAKASAQGCRVMLHGLGGDEWLEGGRKYYADAMAARRWGELLKIVRADAAIVGLNTSLWWAFRHGLVELLPETFKQRLRSLRASDATTFDKQAWLTPDLQNVLRERRERYNSSMPLRGRRREHRRQSYFLYHPYLALVRDLVERQASSMGIEARGPFFNSELIQFSFSVPERYRLRGHMNKYLHRTALSGLLPDAVLMRTTKAEFSVAYRWYLTTIKDWLATHDDDARRWLQLAKVRDVAAAASGGGDHSYREWMLWNLYVCGAVASRRSGTSRLEATHAL